MVSYFVGDRSGESALAVEKWDRIAPPAGYDGPEWR
jgi:hypothetical protein